MVGNKPGPKLGSTWQYSNNTKTNYFFLNGELHKKLHISRHDDTVLTWNFATGKRMVYSYSDVLRKRKRAWTTKEVLKILGGRNRYATMCLMERNGITPPYPAVCLSGKTKGRVRWYFWKSEDIIALHEVMLSTHIGPPRKDGRITSHKRLPSRRELRARLNDDVILYIKQGDGFIPTWTAKDI